MTDLLPDAPEPDLSGPDDAIADAPSSGIPWLRGQSEMEALTQVQRTRLFRLRMRTGQVRVAGVTYLYSQVDDRADADEKEKGKDKPRVDRHVEHLYRVQLGWLAQFDPRDGKTQHFAERTTAGRSVNALQFRVLVTTTTDGRRVTVARLGPKGQIQAEPPGIGLMSLLRALLVEWVGAAHPDATLLSGSLYQAHTPSDAEMALRDAFLTRSGFVVRPALEGRGTFHARSFKELKTTWNGDKVQELTPPLVAEAVGAQMETALLRSQVEALRDQIVSTIREKRASEALQRLWLAITVISIVFGLVFGIQPRRGY